MAEFGWLVKKAAKASVLWLKTFGDKSMDDRVEAALAILAHDVPTRR